MVKGNNSQKAANGKRYTKDERDEIIEFVVKMNGQNGRGGVAAAAKKFGVSASSIGKWINEGSGMKSNGALRSVGHDPRKSAATSRVLSQLIDLRESIDALERELAMKMARFDKLKRKV